MLQSLNDLDNSLMIWLNGHFTSYTDSFFWLFSGKIVWAGLYAVIIYAFFRRYGWRTTVGLLLAVGIIITISDQICGNFARHAFERLRPSNPANPLSQFIHIVNGYRGGPFGFPSCHAANSFALATFVALVFRYNPLTCSMFIWATLTAYSRIVLGVHYPGDLLAGALIGSLTAIVTFYSSRAVYRRWFALRAGFRDATHPTRTSLCGKLIISALLATVIIMAIAAI